MFASFLSTRQAYPSSRTGQKGGEHAFILEVPLNRFHEL